MIDIGVNLTNKRFDKDRVELIARAKSAGVEQLLITGTSVDESRKALALCQQYEQTFPNTLYATAGVHPHDADSVTLFLIYRVNFCGPNNGGTDRECNPR